MQTFKTHVDSLGAEEASKAAEKLENGLEDPEVVLLYFTVEHPDEETIREFVEEVHGNLPDETDVVGISVSGFMTDSTEYLMMRGALAFAVSGVETELNILEGDAWYVDKEKGEELYSENSGPDSENLLFIAGPRQAESSSSALGEKLRKYLVKILGLPGITQKGVDRINRKMFEEKLGYPRVLYGLTRAVEDGGKMMLNDSLDAGKWEKGYETCNGELYRDSGAFNLRIAPSDQLKVEQVMPPTEENIEELDVVEECTDFSQYRNVVYRLEGRTIPEMQEELPFAQERFEEGGFSYYGILVCEKITHAAAISDVPVIGSHKNLDDLEKVLIVRAAPLEEYRSRVKQKLKELDPGNPVMLSVHVSKLNFFQNNTRELKQLVDDRFDDWVFILGDNFVMDQHQNYMYPSVVSFSTD